jgi:serine/threonine kinase 38
MATPVSPKNAADQITPSSSTLEKAQYAKQVIEMKYSKKKRDDQSKVEEWALIDQKMDELRMSHNEKKLMKEEILHQEALSLRKSRKETKIFDFQPEAIIGRGAFGEVRVVRDKRTGQIFALKKLNKSETIRKNQVHHVKSERNVLALAENPWVVDLKSTFQDEKFLYLVMEYLPGGDLMNILIKRDVLPEAEARFYMAECILAVESVHRLNYIHRDLKPDNILIDYNGHVKLADFGLCKSTEIYLDNPYENLTKLEEARTEKTGPYQRSRKLAYSTVGTPDYIAPEVFGRVGYDEKVDWWSLGVIFFEMVVGYPPFYADEPKVTCQKILNWRKTFRVPKDANLSPAAIDLIEKLVCNKENRLGANGPEEIKAHPFFAGVDWNGIRKGSAPWIPELDSDVDTRHFDKFEEIEPFYPPDPIKSNRKKRKDGEFIGFTYKRENSQRTSLISAFENLENCNPTRFSLNPFELNEADSA